LNIGVPNVAIPLRNFADSELKSALVKGEFDVSAMMTNILLLALAPLLDTLSTCG
jgi:hypothetical protein